MLMELSQGKKRQKMIEQQIIRENFYVREYERRDEKPGKGILIGVVEMATGVLPKYPHIRCPNKILIEITNMKTQLKDFSIEYTMNDLGEIVTDDERPIKEVLCRLLVKALEKQEMTGFPKNDLEVSVIKSRY